MSCNLIFLFHLRIREKDVAQYKPELRISAVRVFFFRASELLKCQVLCDVKCMQITVEPQSNFLFKV